MAVKRVKRVTLSSLMEKIKELTGNAELGIDGAQEKLYTALEDLERRILFIEQAITGECDE